MPTDDPKNQAPKDETPASKPNAPAQDPEPAPAADAEPVAATPVADTEPVAATPVADAEPVAATPVADTEPVAATPVADAELAESTPANDATPADGTPAVDEKPKDEAAETDAPAVEGTPEPATDEAPLLVLIVDDDSAFVDEARAGLEAKGMRVLSFASKADLAAWSWDQKPALFVLDFNLGGEDARGLALDAREAGKLGDCPIVLVSETVVEREVVDFSLKLGFRKVLIKPVALDALERVLAEEPRAKTESARREVDQKTFEDRKAAVLKKMGLDETEAAEGTDEPSANGLATKRAPSTVRVPGPRGKTAALSVQPPQVGAKGKTTTVVAPPPQAQAEEQAAGGSCWLRGLTLGFFLPAALAAILAFAVSSGYTSPLVLIEGVILGAVAAFGLMQGLKRLSAPPAPGKITLSIILLTLAVWGLLLGLRFGLGVPFVDRSPEAMKHLNDPGRTIGLAEITAAAYVAAHWILAIGAGLYVVRVTIRRLAREPAR